jgi:hypothetical protein
MHKPDESELAPVVRRAVQVLRADPDIGGDAEQRVLAQLAGAPPPKHAPRGGWGHLAAIGGLGLAAGLAALLLTRFAPVTPLPALQEIRFSITADTASRVSLVGDFNDWNPAGTPLQRTATGEWSVTLPLAPGSYRFSFLLDGRIWRSDPRRPAAPDPDFDTPTSVLTVEHSVL